MFEATEEVTLAVEALKALASQYGRGETIAWKDIQRAIGPRETHRAKHVIRKWRTWLRRERGIVTLAKTDVGVRLLTHRETAEEIPQLRQRKARRQMQRGLRELDTIDLASLPVHERRHVAAQRANMLLQRRELFRSLHQKTEPLPLRAS